MRRFGRRVVAFYRFCLLPTAGGKVAGRHVMVPALLRCPVVKQVIGQPRIVRAVIYAVIVDVRQEVLAAVDAAQRPLFAYGLLRHSVRQHMGVYAVGIFAAPHVDNDFRLRVGIEQPAAEIDAEAAEVLKIVYLVLVILGECAV